VRRFERLGAVVEEAAPTSATSHAALFRRVVEFFDAYDLLVSPRASAGVPSYPGMS
jgi:hypothetical protein